MNRYRWIKVPNIEKRHGVGFWILSSAQNGQIYEWIVREGGVYLRYRPYRAVKPTTVNMLRDGQLQGVYATLTAAKASLIHQSAATVDALN